MSEASDRELLIRIDERVQAFHAALKAHGDADMAALADVKAELKDVKEWYKAADRRIGRLEGWQKKIVGIAIGIGTASGAGASALWKTLTGSGG